MMINPSSHPPIASPSQTKSILKKLGLSTKKRWGQNFLIDSQIVDHILDRADIGSDDYVLEIGPGLGSLSQFLSQQAGFLTLLEIDPQLVKWLSIFFAEAENVEILLQDALTFDFPGHCRQKQKEAYKVVANLPYYITSDLIEHLLVKGGNWQSMTLMMQKEAAARLLAPAGSKDYGPLNLRIAYFAEAEEFLQVPPESFYPQPPVQSSVIFLRRRQKPPVDIKNEKLFFMIIEAALTQRRKTILNNLANSSLGLNKPLWQEVLLSCNIDSKRRGETLTLTEFASIANAIDEELDCQ